MATVMTNFGVLRYLESLGIQVTISPVGDRHVLQHMLEIKLCLEENKAGI